ncbi:MAG: hypothetical protein ACRD1V_04920 [Vicinamibacterales bacterium]
MNAISAGGAILFVDRDGRAAQRTAFVGIAPGQTVQATFAGPPTVNPASSPGFNPKPDPPESIVRAVVILSGDKLPTPCRSSVQVMDALSGRVLSIAPVAPSADTRDVTQIQ